MIYRAILTQEWTTSTRGVTGNDDFFPVFFASANSIKQVSWRIMEESEPGGTPTIWFQTSGQEYEKSPERMNPVSTRTNTRPISQHFEGTPGVTFPSAYWYRTPAAKQINPSGLAGLQISDTSGAPPRPSQKAPRISVTPWADDRR